MPLSLIAEQGLVQSSSHRYFFTGFTIRVSPGIRKLLNNYNQVRKPSLTLLLWLGDSIISTSFSTSDCKLSRPVPMSVSGSRMPRSTFVAGIRSKNSGKCPGLIWLIWFKLVGSDLRVRESFICCCCCWGILLPSMSTSSMPLKTSTSDEGGDKNDPIPSKPESADPTRLC